MATKFSTSSDNSLGFEEYQETVQFIDSIDDDAVSDDKDQLEMWAECGREGEEKEGMGEHSCYCIANDIDNIYDSCDDCEPNGDNSFDDCDADDDKGLHHQGTNYPNFVRTLQHIENEDLVCLICQVVAISPLQSHCCGKIYCIDCVHKFQRRNPNPICPTCRKPGVKFFEDKRANRTILGLQVYCDLRKKGCKWQGTLSDRQSHSEKCNYRLILCPNDCGKTFRHLQLTKHLHRSCPNRLYACVDCGESGKWQYFHEIHSKECTNKIVTCSNEGCAEKVKKSNIAAHQLTCSKKIIECSFKDMGCMAMFKREDSTKHSKAYKKKHNAYALVKARRPFIQKGHLHQIAPVVLTVDGFTKSETLRSLPFFTSLGGYKMSLLVKNKRDASIDVFVCMMPGEYDKTLHWPLEANVTVQLLNQVEDDTHLTLSTDIFVVKDSYYTKREESSNYYKGIEIGSFAVFDNIYEAFDDKFTTSNDQGSDVYQCMKQKGFLVDDCLYFRVLCSDNCE